MTRLSVEECISGMDKTTVNAERLTKEGELLEDRDSPTAIFLYTIAAEELSKAYILGIAAISIMEKGKLDWKRFWKGFRDHKFKQTGLLKMVLLAQKLVAYDFDDIKKKKPDILFMYKSRKDVIKNINKLHEDIKRVKDGEMERLKWRHLYVDFSDGQWEVPKVEVEKGFLSKNNIKAYLVDLKRMKSDIEEEVKRRDG